MEESFFQFQTKPYLSYCGVFEKCFGFDETVRSIGFSLFLSIHRSNRSFLKRQRLPSLNATPRIFSSLRYLYSVSGEIPRYSDASRNVITSFCFSIFCPVSPELRVLFFLFLSIT